MAIFHLEAHPNVTWYYQCVTYNVFPSYAHELTYTVFGMVMMYAFPLLVIIYSYASILLEIFRRTRNPGGGKILKKSNYLRRDLGTLSDIEDATPITQS